MSQNLKSALQNVLADSFVLYYKTHAFHWNVTGKRFKQLHDMFEEQYTDIWRANDDIAERIRTLGEFAPVSVQSIMKQSTLDETSQNPDAEGMIEILANDNREIVKTMYKALHAAEEDGDEATLDMMVERIRAHEKAAWMLESSVDKG